ncbi:MAG: DUF3575 domain-containing protein [Bacteroidetes bacterium]|nr:MAG: DUF3575 domain-containing protein [Bacteroidota bacterium]
MRKQKNSFEKIKKTIFILFSLSFMSVSAQKNAIMIRPFNAIESILSLSYERQVYKNFSIVVALEGFSGPRLFSSVFQKAIQDGMGLSREPTFKFTGVGVVPEIRYYFKEIDTKEVDKVYINDKKIMGWFVGGYIPIRYYNYMRLDVLSAELYANAIQQDRGYAEFFQKTSVGFGLTGGRHWVWQNFSFEILIGFAVSSGVGQTKDFNFNRPGVGDYTISKDLGYFGNFLQINPRIGMNLGVAF